MNLFELAGRYVGIPFREHGRDMDGLDCYGLFLLFCRELGYQLDDYLYNPSSSKGDYNLFFENYYKSLEKIPENEMLMAGNAILFKGIDGFPTHIGVYLGNGKFIHCLKKVGVVISKLNQEPFKSRIEERFKLKKC